MSLAQSSNIPPNANEYGGDEISAIVLDTGFTTVRAGFAGEDTPKSIVPTYYGVLSGRTLIGESKVNNPIPGLEIRHPFEKGDVSGTEKLNAIKDYAISSRLIPRKSRTIRDGGSKTNGGDKDVEMRDAADEQAKEEQEGGGLLRDTPLLSTEQDNVDEKSREAAIKHAFEVWDAPAYYAVRKSMVSTFSYGKHSAMVVDVGHRGVTVSPVWDGVLLTKSKTIVYSGIHPAAR